ncbi:hypothetical protein L1I30_02825 [Gillisia sp. M10.2A]|uniref:Signal peptidase n=1 Tax=Gillisia lutea TaxID=2909668 RepID=A0ABS9ECK7_9FLAO|nr:hypothetical protein [Gillisia lutea]MCF4100592.1 hypothetical protein [Gillisia lutea]
MRYTILRNIFPLFFLLMMCGNCLAVAEQEPPTPQKQGIPPPPGLPIDDYIPVLIIAGVLLGVYVLRNKKPA